MRKKAQDVAARGPTQSYVPAAEPLAAQLTAAGSAAWVQNQLHHLIGVLRFASGLRSRLRGVLARLFDARKLLAPQVKTVRTSPGCRHPVTC
jgi:hypothetical protein